MTITAIVAGAASMLGRRVSKHLRQAGFEVMSCGRAPASDIVPDLGNFEDVGCPRPIDAEVLFRCAATFAADDFASTVENEPVSNSGVAIAKIAYEALGRGGNISEDAKKRPCTQRFISGSSDLYDGPGISPQVSIIDDVDRLIRECGSDRLGELDVAW